MRLLLAPLALLFSVSAAAQSVPDARHTLMPVPSHLEWGTGVLRLDSLFGITSRGAPGDGRLERGVTRFRTRLGARTGIQLMGGGAALAVTAAGAGQAVQGLDENESYTLRIGPGGARLDAPTTVGVLRGLETVLQLVQSDSAGWYLPAVSIDDAPRFAWRGLLIDVGRHFEPAEVIKRQLDGMAAVKLNVLHWHLSEDQGFRVESRKYPLLQQKGSDGQFYTQAQLRDVVAYARDRGIRVVPEFDMPGHSTAWFVGYPRYSSGPGPFSIIRTFGVFPPAFDPTREEVYNFLDGLIGEMAAIFPDAYWHIGGDEVDPHQWQASARIAAFMKTKGFAKFDQLQAYFNQRMSVVLTKHGKRMVGWDEILHPDLPTTTVVQSWRGQESLGEGARRGFSGILSAGYYLDHMRTTEYHYLVDPLPAGNTLTPAEAARVLGGEACMWHEHVTALSIDSRIWPRMAGIAERFWSPREVRDVPDMYRRLAVMRERLEELGLDNEGHTPRMARRLVQGGSAESLVSLLSLTEPVSFGERIRGQKLTTLVPLVFVVDAARPDPPAHWNTRALAAAALGGDADARQKLRDAFTSWPTLAPAIDAMGLRVPLVRDASPAARALGRVSAIGLEALDQLGKGPASAEWVKSRTAALDTLARPQGLLRISVIPAVRQLVTGAGAQVP